LTRRLAVCITALLLVGVTVAVTRDGSGERRGGPLLVWTDGDAFVSLKTQATAAAAFGMPSFAIRDELVIDRVELVDADPALRLVASRISFLACPACRRRPGYVGVNGFVTSVCIGPFPPPGFGPTYEAAGLRLFPGDVPSLLLYLVADQLGRHDAAGFRVHYRTARGKRYVVEARSMRVGLESLDPRLGEGCSKPRGTVWTGGTEGVQGGVPLD
jgi:hypothetical protein